MKLARFQSQICALCSYRAIGGKQLFSTTSQYYKRSGNVALSNQHDDESQDDLPKRIRKRSKQTLNNEDAANSRAKKPSGNKTSSNGKASNLAQRLKDSPAANLAPRQRTKVSDRVLQGYLIDRHALMLDRLAQSMDGDSEVEGWGIKSPTDLYKKGEQFGKRLASLVGSKDPDAKRVWKRLRRAYDNGGESGVDQEMKYRLSSFILDAELTHADVNNHRKLADLRFPIEWYPATRAMQRKIHLHVGPTNSGKTYQALKRLENAQSGMYAGPLRLLAHEVYSRLNAKGKPCALITGEEKRFPVGYDKLAGSQMISCTVEMMPVNVQVDVAVIDEIQLIGDTDRGWAWTNALMGVQAKEVHLCGELRTVQLIEDLCRAMGDELVVHKYDRLSPLRAMDRHLGSLHRLEKGDCVIVFSRVGIHAMKKDIEAATGKRCAMIYGGLPPETRAQQAALFNDQDNDYDFLCASDAVGMGLNLSIKRVIFEATSKHNGTRIATLSVPEIKQIAGRAGRFRTAADATKLPEYDPTKSNVVAKPENPGSVGLVTTLESYDLKIVSRALASEPSPMVSAGIFPPNHIITKYAAHFPPDTPFSYILLRLHEISTTHPRFHLCSFKDHLAIADCIQPFNLPITDKLIFVAAPINLRSPGTAGVVSALARCLAEQSSGELLDIPEIDLTLLDEEGNGKNYLNKLEELHRHVLLYLWLSYRFAGVYRSQALAFHVKDLLETKINESISKIDFSATGRQQLEKVRRQVAEEAEEDFEAEEAEEVRDTPIALPLDWEDGNTEPILEIPDGVVRGEELVERL